MDQVKQIIQRQNIFSHVNEGILVAQVPGTTEGFGLAKEILLETSGKNTALYLSGGRTPKDFYHILSTEKEFEAGALGLVDERFGGRFHVDSNEKMIMDSGLIQSMERKGAKFHTILTVGQDMEKTAEEYDQTLRSLHATYNKSIGILGVGMDGHTAGIPSLSSKVKIQNSNLGDKHVLVAYYDEIVGMYGKRVTMTFLGLSMLDLLIVMVFGEDKKEALTKMFSDGSEEEIPSRFYKRSEIASKTVLITDQKI